MTAGRRRTARLAALALAWSAGAASSAEPVTVHVRVLPATYVVGERRFDDVRSLERHLHTVRARTVAIDDCAGNASPSRAIPVAESLYRARGAVELRALPASDPVCVYAHDAARRRSADAGAARNDGHLAVDRRGRSVLP